MLSRQVLGCLTADFHFSINLVFESPKDSPTQAEFLLSKGGGAEGKGEVGLPCLFEPKLALLLLLF